MFDCKAARTACSLGISLMPASPRGNTMCAIDVQINMATAPRIPARRIFMSGRMQAGREIWKKKLAGGEIRQAKDQKSSKPTSVLRDSSGSALLTWESYQRIITKI